MNLVDGMFGLSDAFYGPVEFAGLFFEQGVGFEKEGY